MHPDIPGNQPPCVQWGAALAHCSKHKVSQEVLSTVSLPALCDSQVTLGVTQEQLGSSCGCWSSQSSFVTRILQSGVLPILPLSAVLTSSWELSTRVPRPSQFIYAQSPLYATTTTATTQQQQHNSNNSEDAIQVAHSPATLIASFQSQRSQ